MSDAEGLPAYRAAPTIFLYFGAHPRPSAARSIVGLSMRRSDPTIGRVTRVPFTRLSLPSLERA